MFLRAAFTLLNMKPSSSHTTWVSLHLIRINVFIFELESLSIFPQKKSSKRKAFFSCLPQRILRKHSPNIVMRFLFSSTSQDGWRRRSSFSCSTQEALLQTCTKYSRCLLSPEISSHFEAYEAVIYKCTDSFPTPKMTFTFNVSLCRVH